MISKPHARLLNIFFVKYALSQVNLERQGNRKDVRIVFNPTFDSNSWVLAPKYSGVLTTELALEIANGIIANIPVETIPEDSCSSLLTKTYGNQSEVARLLGISRGSLRTRLDSTDKAEPYYVINGCVYVYKGEANYE